MKISYLIACFAFMGFTFINSGDPKTLNLTSSLTLTIQSSSGTNASSVAYNPDKKLYYTSFAGNTTYPLEVFSERGAYLYGTTTMCDVRGMWMYNGKLYAASAGTEGVYEYSLNSNGYPISNQTVISAITKPDFNSCASFDTKKKKMLFYDNGNIYYNSTKKDNLQQKIRLQIPLGSSTSSINEHNVIYTGKKGYELGVLDHSKKAVLLFDAKGKHTATCNLPYTAPCDDRFCFSYANSYIWLYDTEAREWYGYKLDL